MKEIFKEIFNDLNVSKAERHLEKVSHIRVIINETLKTLMVVVLVISAIFIHVAVPKEDLDVTVLLFMIIWDLCCIIAVLSRILFYVTDEHE